jgi:hypothetical protein
LIGPAAGKTERERPSPGRPDQKDLWRRTSLKLDRNLDAAKSALEHAQDTHDEDDGVTVVGRGRRAGATGPGARRMRRGIGNDDSSDYTDYSHEKDLDELEVTVEDAQQAIADLHDQARRSGVPQGWLRR